MTDAPESKKKKRNISLKNLMDNNKFVFLLSLVVAFAVWVAVAMYKSPEESYTIYNVPITIDTENSIVSQKGFTNFWQSAEQIDVTVTGPRYMVTALTADDITVTAVLNTVDSAGISELTLRVSLVESNDEITISSMSKTSIEVYFDVEMTMEFNITIDDSTITEHIAEGYNYENSALTLTTVELKGPETEINKIVDVVATPQYPEENLYQTSSIPVTLNLEGATAADTVSVNTYVAFVDDLEYFVNIEISRSMELAPAVEFTGTEISGVTTAFDVEAIGVKYDTSKDEYGSDTLTVLTVDYSDLAEGTNTYEVSISDLTLPDGMTITDDLSTVTVVITVPEE
ncbi:MAG: hypothetical protein LUH40_01465 [Clostridiales bacterium]|nr:hypothetical protein [Clostridiales bacterium]